MPKVKTKKKKAAGRVVAGQLIIRLVDADWDRIGALREDYKRKHGASPSITQVVQDALSLAHSFVATPVLPSADEPIKDLFSYPPQEEGLGHGSEEDGAANY